MQHVGATRKWPEDFYSLFAGYLAIHEHVLYIFVDNIYSNQKEVHVLGKRKGNENMHHVFSKSGMNLEGGHKEVSGGATSPFIPLYRLLELAYICISFPIRLRHGI